MPKRYLIIGLVFVAAVTLGFLITRPAGGGPEDSGPASAARPLLAAHADRAGHHLEAHRKALKTFKWPAISSAGEIAAPALYHSASRAPVPILMYHRVGELLPGSHRIARELTVKPEDFRRQMAWLKKAGYVTLLQSELPAVLKRGLRPKGRPIVITFDDGYKDAFTVVWPILHRFGFRADFFVLTSRTGAGQFLSWSDMRTMRAGGMEIGSHTVSHLDVAKAPPKSVWSELTTSKRVLERGLGVPVTAFCYPFGKNDATATELVRKAGYLTAVTTKFGRAKPGVSLLLMPRVRVCREMTMKRFRALVR